MFRNWKHPSVAGLSVGSYCARICVGAVGHQNDSRVGWKAAQQGGNGLIEIAEGLRAKAAELRLRYARRVEEQFLIHANQRQLFQLPLIHFNRGLSNLIEKILKSRERAHAVSKLGGAHPLRALAQDKNPAARLCDVLRGGDSLDGLVESQVQRISGGAGDYRIGRLGQCFERGVLKKLDGCRVSLDRVAREDSRDLAFLRQRHIQNKVVAGHARNLEQLGVQRIVDNGTLCSERLAHEARRVNYLDGFLSSQARSDQLTPAGKAQHQMLLDEAKRDMQTGSHETLVDVNRSSTLRCAQRAMPRKIARIMADDAISSCDFGANNEFDLFCSCPAMQARCNKNRDAFDRNSGGVKSRE